MVIAFKWLCLTWVPYTVYCFQLSNTTQMTQSQDHREHTANSRNYLQGFFSNQISQWSSVDLWDICAGCYGNHGPVLLSPLQSCILHSGDGQSDVKNWSAAWRLTPYFCCDDGYDRNNMTINQRWATRVHLPSIQEHICSCKTDLSSWKTISYRRMSYIANKTDVFTQTVQRWCQCWNVISEDSGPSSLWQQVFSGYKIMESSHLIPLWLDTSIFSKQKSQQYLPTQPLLFHLASQYKVNKIWSSPNTGLLKKTKTKGIFAIIVGWMTDFIIAPEAIHGVRGMDLKRKKIYELNVLYIKSAKREVVLTDSTIEQNTWICDPNLDLENSEEKSERPTHNPPC